MDWVGVVCVSLAVVFLVFLVTPAPKRKTEEGTDPLSVTGVGSSPCRGCGCS